MFDGIASRYDLLNRIISFGIDKSWRRRASAALALSDKGARVLDVATGTADLAIEIATSHASVEVVGVDPSAKMLEVASAKIGARGLSRSIELEIGEAEKLPFPDGSFEGVTIAFGIRNVADRPRGLREMKRVTKPGGKVVVLELSEPKPGVMGSLARVHVHRVVPFVGGLLSGKKEYGYLQASIAAFPPAETFCKMMEEAGLVNVTATPLTMGVAHLYVGEAPASDEQAAP
ncbi:MAG: bifunctional demethylmenaquinone methyltransferase/2-methoxy-6-polyprenyl-1,4-benzoquinol methylase UbiE [Polyangiaceae bacterium]|nr:bifunctional demethylmenaquinone methyltransferase/2-methoxy-6-polyprenyl-1,4-benzoquinol methylase UbiE [Polyangiaceae bacterium]